LSPSPDLFEERGRSMAKEFRVSRIFRKGRDLVRDRGIEAVMLAIPTAGRAELAGEAFRLGKHVLIEKPPVMHAGEIIEMMRLQGSCVGACCSSRLLFLSGFEAA
jgi:predicted dehydrogenase